MLKPSDRFTEENGAIIVSTACERVIYQQGYSRGEQQQLVGGRRGREAGGVDARL